jgi:hypothetical protein
MLNSTSKKSSSGKWLMLRSSVKSIFGERVREARELGAPGFSKDKSFMYCALTEICGAG